MECSLPDVARWEQPYAADVWLDEDATISQAQTGGAAEAQGMKKSPARERPAAFLILHNYLE